MKNNIFTLIILALLIGCTDSTTTPEESAYRFFPLETGRFAEYEVQETSYAVGKTPVSTKYYLKEIYGSETLGASGRVQYQIKRYRRNTIQQNWVADSVLTAYLLPDRAVKTENNRSFLKMIFPLYEGLSWNGNQYNTLPAQNYVAHFNKIPFTLNSLSFAESLDIIQQRDSSLVTLVKFTERYAPNVGLIYKESTALDYCQKLNCLGSGVVESGTKKTMSLIAHGKE